MITSTLRVVSPQSMDRWRPCSRGTTHCAANVVAHLQGSYSYRNGQRRGCEGYIHEAE